MRGTHRHAFWRRASVTAIISGVLVVGTVASAQAAAPADPPAEPVLTIQAPSSATSAWVELEQAGLRGTDVVVQVDAGAGWADVGMSSTTWGLHGETGVRAEEPFAVRVTGSSSLGDLRTPDLAVTLLDAEGHQVLADQARLALTPGAGGIDPGSGQGGGSASGSGPAQGASDALSATGATDVVPAALVAVLLLAAGLSVVAGRRARTIRGRAST
ncbi:hypothetical protein GCM10010988_33940 [Cnuibacter physcomitrellae]|uniref:Uncharacterized protein n=1 Tax=Cnuibacter physcomitrellae TaxID=1619308 RepID=A0A1X9LRP3_9MICO|nr:hypothetical protein [Cnuibacter physcomitrellae]ARJ04590.1 hypothetical protein B5808_04640 [Cnuibacter physcomitrellae]GGI41406.1 hypothetical protein GCM10010988_33940 [Cnuibacter physcomitrellae]